VTFSNKKVHFLGVEVESSLSFDVRSPGNILN